MNFQTLFMTSRTSSLSSSMSAPMRRLTASTSRTNSLPRSRPRPYLTPTGPAFVTRANPSAGSGSRTYSLAGSGLLTVT